MKRALCIAMSAFILLSALLFAGCGEGGGEGAEDIVRVVVIDNGEPFTPEQSVYTVPRGEDLTLRLYADRGYAFDRCDYASYSVKEEEPVLSEDPTSVEVEITESESKAIASEE